MRFNKKIRTKLCDNELRQQRSKAVLLGIWGEYEQIWNLFIFSRLLVWNNEHLKRNKIYCTRRQLNFKFSIQKMCKNELILWEVRSEEAHFYSFISNLCKEFIINTLWLYVNVKFYVGKIFSSFIFMFWSINKKTKNLLPSQV